MTDVRIKQLRAAIRDCEPVDAWWQARVVELLDTIVALKAEIKDANKAIKLAMKGRK
jgi:hypothetical protein